jgi:hypothetical protein
MPVAPENREGARDGAPVTRAAAFADRDEPAVTRDGAGSGGGGALSVPTQRSATWQAGSDIAPGQRRPVPVLKIALVLVPALLVIAGVAGYLGMRAGEHSSAGPEERATGATAATGGTTSSAPTEATSEPAPPQATSATASAPPSPTPSATPSGGEGSSSPSPKASPSPSGSAPADVPDGWYRYKDSTGFSVGLPKGWKVSSRSGTQVWFRGPGSPGSLLIDQTSTPKSDAEKDWRAQEPGARSRFGGYKLIKIKSVDYWQTAADWEFTYGSGSGRTHVVNRGFVTDKHHGYALYWSTPDSRWDEDHHYFETFTATFKPAK